MSTIVARSEALAKAATDLDLDLVCHLVNDQHFSIGGGELIRTVTSLVENRRMDILRELMSAVESVKTLAEAIEAGMVVAIGMGDVDTALELFETADVLDSADSCLLWNRSDLLYYIINLAKDDRTASRCLGILGELYPAKLCRCSIPEAISIAKRSWFTDAVDILSAM